MRWVGSKRNVERVKMEQVRGKTSWWSYLGLGIASLILAAVGYELWRTDLATPFVYDYDAIPHQVWVQGMIENGWYLENPRLGAPGMAEMHDFPLVEALHLSLIGLIGQATGDSAITINVFYLLTFPLVAWAAYAALRQMRLSASVAFAASLLYTCQTYHWSRGESHLFLSAYYMVPLSILVALWVMWDRPRDGSNVGSCGFSEGWTGRRTLAAVAICFLQASSGIYYAFFACFFLLVAGVSGWIEHRSVRIVARSIGLILVVTLGVSINLIPTFVYWSEHGINQEAIGRPASDTEVYGLKFTQLVLPAEGHQWKALRKLKERYETQSVLSNENSHSSLGILAAAGFLGLLALSVWRTVPRSRLVDHLATLNLSGFLLGTIGGVGSLFGFLVSSQIRCYNRVSIFIAFFALAACAVVADRWLAGGREMQGSRSRRVWGIILMLVTFLGLADQIPKNRMDRGRIESEWKSDRAFFGGMEAALPVGAMVVQYPYVPYLGSGMTNSMHEYTHARAYLHTKTLRISYASMRARAATSGIGTFPCFRWNINCESTPHRDSRPSMWTVGPMRIGARRSFGASRKS